MKKIRLSEAIEGYHAWQKDIADFSDSTVSNSRWVLKAMLRQVGDVYMENLTRKHLETWFALLGTEHEVHNRNYYRTNKALSNSGWNFYRQRVKAFLAWATSEDYIRQDLLLRIRPRKVADKVRQRPAPDLLMALLDKADNAMERAYIGTAINTALRQSELIKLRVGDIDLNSGFAYVTIYKTGGTDEQPITKELDREMRRWFTAYAENIGRPLDPDDYLFPRKTGNLYGPWEFTEDGSRVPTRTPIVYHPEDHIPRANQIVKKALAKLDLPVKYEGTHTIRRAVARAYYDMLVANGEPDPMGATKNMLHHKNIATTERYLGINTEKEARNRTLRGKSFLPSLTERDNVVQLVRDNGGNQ